MGQRRHQAGSSKGGQFAAGAVAARAAGAQRPGFARRAARPSAAVTTAPAPDSRPAFRCPAPEEMGWVDDIAEVYNGHNEVYETLETTDDAVSDCGNFSHGCMVTKKHGADRYEWATNAGRAGVLVDHYVRGTAATAEEAREAARLAVPEALSAAADDPEVESYIRRDVEFRAGMGLGPRELPAETEAWAAARGIPVAAR